MSAVFRRLTLAGALTAFAVSGAGCASGPPLRDAPSSSTRGESVTHAVSQPVRDLNLMRDPQAAALTKAYATPYGRPPVVTCAALNTEIAELDAALGKDLDAAEWKAALGGDRVNELALDAIRDLAGLPFRSIVRRASGADQRDRLQKAAVLSGFVRRAYLKGLGEAQGCKPPAAPAPLPPAKSTTP